ncbi:hypothetical protein R84B8_02015 [Treponema sp. R8-4-B8]
MNFFSQELHTKITKVQRSQRGERGFCLKAKLELHAKIADINPLFLFVSFSSFVFFVRVFSKNILEYNVNV